MHQSERQTVILRSLEKRGVCTVTDLAGRLSVSDETIRRDIKAMANRGLVQRVHGAVVLPDLFREPTFQRRLSRHAEAKQTIAKLAADCVADGDSVMLDTGSTTAYVARALAGHSGLTVVTNCCEIAATLGASGRNDVYLAGGSYRSDDSAVFGNNAIEFVRQFRVRLAFLSIGAINLEDGLMDYHLNEAEFSRAVIGQANHTCVVADSSKFGNQAPMKVCGLETVDSIIVETEPKSSFIHGLQDADVTVITPRADE
ncbi:MAG: DeoR/GlpR family DNA-binding transcription regulator [Pseudomonadota bacterium]